MSLPWEWTEEVQVWCARIDADTDAVERANRQLSRNERDRASRFRLPSPRVTFVLSRAVLRTLLAHFCGCSPQEVEFAYGKQGKPYLASPIPAIRFNVSHSGNIAAFAFAANDELGVDVEQHRPMTDMEQIAHRFFSPGECQDLLRIPEGERVAAFFDGWVRKEAFIKALGQGLSIPLDSFRVSLTPGQPAALLTVDGEVEASAAWSITEFSPEEGYSGAVALRRQPCAVRVHNLRPALELLANPMNDWAENSR